ncbi:lipopolysaccharide biosynthesis protein [Sanguibacter inulinus]|uniref:Lipopolysaccharide biosynthesis protein n=1 Tax=Sanguibacter inulinus TaxID=60922 RepID=A0A853ETV5_9MICO|nr:lipopolysaccharide biosynthesis protein [Sanguibacter inulinus]MBF0722786.1 lipopolysaccharide biosynthesis protein [Sanguibacter inulinus]NYS93931.1 lipopolysaccharide biosynthesis protein [Sanguibacter inulinus]
MKRAAVGKKISGVARASLSITAGVGAGQLILIAISPVLTRLFTPQEFGHYTILISVIAVMSVAATLRFEAAIPLAMTAEDALGVARAGVASTLFFSFLVIPILIAVELVIPWKLLPDGGGAQLWVLVPAVIAFGLYELGTQFAIRRQRYGAVGARSLIQSGGTALGQLSFGVLGVGSGLIWGQILGKLLAVGFLAPLVRTESRDLGRVPKLREIFKKYKRFPLFLAPSSLFNVLGTQAPYLMIGAVFGAPAIGFLGLIQRLVAAPQALVGQAIGQVYVGEAAARLRGGAGDSRRPFVRATSWLVIIALPIGVGMALIPGSLLGAIFGTEWEGASAYLSAFAPAFVAQFVVAPVSQTLIIAGRQRLQLMWDVSRVIIVSSAIIAVHAYGGSAVDATWAFSIASVMCYGALWFLCLAAASRPVADSSEDERPRQN